MPPPSAPASKPTDPTDLADALTSAGIDLKEEEARLSHFTRAGPGTLLEDEATRLVQRRYAESRAHHLANPFLETPVLSSRLHRKTKDTQCQPFVLNTTTQPPPQGGQADIIALLSLGARERVNQIMTRAIVLARTRRKGTNVVTGEWANAVRGATLDNGPASAISPMTIPNKRSFSSFGEFLPPIPTPMPTTTLPNETAKALRALQQQEFQKEQQRLAKKARREGGVMTAGGSATGPSTPTALTPGGGGDSGPLTPGADGMTLMGGGERKMTAKESKKQRESKLDEANTHRAANVTANIMMRGIGGGRKKKTYSWMSAAGGGLAGMSMAPRGPPGASLSSPDMTGSAGAGDSGLGMSTGSQGHWVGGQRIGAWREDGEKGLGIQMRDWVGALEGDSRGVKRGLIKAYLRMK